MLVLALESSTSSAKALLFDTEKGVLDSKSKKYDSSICADGKTDTDAVFRLTMALDRETAAGRKIDAVALCGTWHSISVCDDSMFPVTPTFSWEFMEPSEQCRKIRRNDQIAGACNCINWFVDRYIPGKLSFEELEKPDNVLRDIPVFLPFLYGERCPGWHDDRLGGFAEVKPSHSILDFYRALQAGILFNVFQCYEILCKECGEPEQIFLSGGILNSEQWTQMAADVLNRELYCMKIRDASLMGAVVLALLAAGEIPDISEIPEECTASKIVRPRAEFTKYYHEQYGRYKYWYEKTMQY